MKVTFFCYLSIFVYSISIAQVNTFNKDEELRKFVERGGSIKEVYPNTFQLTYRTGEQRTYFFNSIPDKTPLPNNVDTTIINVWEIDTLLYYHKFSFWQKINIVNSFLGTVPLGDNNKNGRIELYGFNEVNYPFVGPVVVFEQDAHGIFRKVYSYDSNSVFVQGIGDVDSDGNNEIHLRVNDTLNGKFYKSDTTGELPTSFDFIFYFYPNQIEDMNFGDYDKNHITDYSFIDGNNPSRVIISEFRDSLNNFTSIFERIIDEDIPAGTAIGDFDQDGKTELVFGTALGKLFVIEAINENQYSVIYQGLAPAYNAYMFTQTDDIDKNGKPEFWVGGQDHSAGVSRFMCYEASNDNNYLPVAYIEFRYLVSFDAKYIQAADVDNDGTQELIISLGNHLIILTFSGFPNHHSYEIFYAKINEHTQVGAHFRPVTLFDANHDGRIDILLPMDKYVAPNTIVFSYLYIQDTITSVIDHTLTNANEFLLSQNYPNPFNPLTRLNFALSKQTKVKISVYNLLGEEIKTLLYKELQAGEYNIEWNGKDSNENILNSGVYIIKMEAYCFTKLIKTILLK